MIMRPRAPWERYEIGKMTTITVTAPGGRRVELQNAMRLTPTAGTEMHGRDGMLMHNGNFATMDSSNFASSSIMTSEVP